MVGTIPSNLSFKACIDSVRPKAGVPGSHASTSEHWLPPDRQDRYETLGTRIYRWRGGTAVKLPGNTSLPPENIFSTATIFTQSPSCNHLVAVNFDARITEVRSNGNWRKLGFDSLPSTAKNHRMSYVMPAGGKPRLPGPPTLPKLLPSCYNYINAYDKHGNSVPATKTNDGIIGHLATVVGLAAFSAPDAQMDDVFIDHLRANRFIGHTFHNGRNIENRGLVVTVYLDSENTEHSTRPLLTNLENGEYGPFYSC